MVTQALKNEFVAKSWVNHPRGGGVFDAQIIPKMRRYAEAPALRRLAVLVEAHLLGAQDDEGIRKVVLTFRAADESGLGELRSADIAAALRNQGLEVPADLDEICGRVDISQARMRAKTEPLAVSPSLLSLPPSHTSGR